MVPEYQLRLPWRQEGDVVIFDNYVVKHRVVADFYDIPPGSRALNNCGTRGYPHAQNVLVPGTEVRVVSRSTGEKRSLTTVPREQNSRARALARL